MEIKLARCHRRENPYLLAVLIATKSRILGPNFQKSTDFAGAVEIAAATAENHAILVQVVSLAFRSKESGLRKGIEGRHVCHLCGACARTLLPLRCRIPPVPFPPPPG